MFSVNDVIGENEEVESSSTDIHGFHNAGKTRALVEADGKDFKLLQWVDVYGNNISRFGTHRRGGGSSRLVWTFLPHPCPPLHAQGR